jgi:hypothetical protein
LWHDNTPNRGNWEQAFIDISSYQNQTIQLRFKGTVYSSGNYDVSFDKVKIQNTLIFNPLKPSEEGSTTNSLGAVAEAPTLSVAPNPFQEQLHVQTNLPDVQGYRITNLQGKVVQDGRWQRSLISVVDLPVGVYFITLYNESEQLTQKIVKQ